MLNPFNVTKEIVFTPYRDTYMEKNRIFFLFACKATLFAPIWPIALPIFCINGIRQTKKELHYYMCPKCEKKFLDE